MIGRLIGFRINIDLYIVLLIDGWLIVGGLIDGLMDYLIDLLIAGWFID